MGETKITKVAEGVSGICHSPGPWIADDFCEEDGQNIRVGTSDGTQLYYHATKTICICHGPEAADEDGDIPLLTQIANARLIAAAPDLLEALKLFVADWDNDQSPPRKVWIARAAIAKAER